MASTSCKSNKDVRLVVLAGVADAHLEGDAVVGHWEQLKPRFSRPDRMVAQNFLNWPDTPAGILRFVRRYGFLDKPDTTGNFRQSLQAWRDHQAFIRTYWAGPTLDARIGMQSGEMLHVKGNQLLIDAESLGRFIELETFLTPATYRRICAHPDCTQERYFIAVNTKQRFCSRECVTWSLREHQKEWWREHGQQWRKSRKPNIGRKAPWKKGRGRGVRRSG